ncbi:MAG: response regulator transcription factor [Cyclobacteriaceae bacterium]|nr:response regulator transcription factor [Cyclobacteriaceae bacterium]
MSKLKIYIADDHTFVRKGMIRLLNTFERVGDVKEAANGKELISLVQGEVPNIVILDLEMPVMNGFDCAKHLVENHSDVKILILTMHTEEVFILNLMELGVHGFLNKNAEPEEVEKALYAIADRDFYRNDIINMVLQNKIKRHRNVGSTHLSARELEILLLICQELTPVEIAKRLQISEKTFFNHRANVLSKVNARGNVGLVKYAYQQGIIELPPLRSI